MRFLNHRVSGKRRLLSRTMGMAILLSATLPSEAETDYLASASEPPTLQILKSPALKSQELLNQSDQLATLPPKATAVDTTQQEIKVLHAQIETMQRDYTTQLEKMQATIAALSGQISKLAGPSSTSSENVNPKPVIDPADQDIGETLIFGDGDVIPAPTLATGSALGTGAPSTQPLRTTQSGYGIGGRSLLNNLTQPFSSSNGSLGQSMNPDIMVTGDFLGNYANRKSVSGRKRFSLREAEIGFSAAIDPYTKGTFIFAKPEDEELEVEEGYITLLSLPFGLQAKLGKMRSPFGKLNTTHTHDLPQVDRPNVYNHFFGDEGLVESGVALSRILPTPWFSSIDVQVGNGDSNPLFGGGRFSRPVVISHLKQFFELSSTQTLEVGLSTASGPSMNSTPSRLSTVGGLDITYRWLPANQYHALIWQTELMAARNQSPGFRNDRVWGGYSYLEAKLNNRWSAGLRVDYTQLPQAANTSELAFAPYIDYWQSEFARWRLQYKHTFATQQAQSSDQAFLQYSVIMGLHPPHTF
jgi:hypothetical protein